MTSSISAAFISQFFIIYCPPVTTMFLLLRRILLLGIVLPPLLLLLPAVVVVNASPVLPGPPIFEAISHYPSLCYLPPESGMCPALATNGSSRTSSAIIRSDKAAATAVDEAPAHDAPVDDTGANAADDDDAGDDAARHGVPLLTRYYFDAVTAQCYPFGAQTCGGNENRFRTHAQCMAKCRIGND